MWGLYRTSPPGGATRLQLFRQWWGVEVCKAAFWPLLPADGVLWLDWPPGLEREHHHQEQLHAALPLLLSEHLHHHRKRLRQRLLWGPDARLARLRHGKWHLWVVFVVSSSSSVVLTPCCCWPPGLRRQRGALARHKHRGRPGNLCGSGCDRGTAAAHPLPKTSASAHILTLDYSVFQFFSVFIPQNVKLKALRSNIETNLDENSIRCCSAF